VQRHEEEEEEVRDLVMVLFAISGQVLLLLYNWKH
jgi:hypothetical protein